MNVFDTLMLPNGSTVKNRIAKAAMEENMADADQAPSEALMRLYQAWADGGAGLIITGNVMVDGRAMTGPGGVVLQDDQQLDKFKRWARIGRSGGAQFWLQINHPGRQMQSNLGQKTWAPSAVPLELGTMSKRFATPHAMPPGVIEEVIQRFANTARLGEQAGFTGVEIHAAHGYLLSQFLSPLTNQRKDEWGGSLENRARLLLEIVKAVRAVVSVDFAVAVKLNSADFQRGGFTTEDAKKVVEWLFVEFARDLQTVAKMPVMVTGGIRRRAVAESVVQSGVDMVGIGTALAIDPHLPRDWLQGKDNAPQLPAITWKNKAIASLANMAVVKFQLRKLSRAKKPDPSVSPLRALIVQQLFMAYRTRQYRKWIETSAHDKGLGDAR